MSHSLTSILLHCIWTTKKRLPLINPIWENTLYAYIQDQFEKLNCEVFIINGVSNHVHVLFKSTPLKSPSEIIKQVKGSSSHFINSSDSVQHKFAWQGGYYLVSVSPNRFDAVYNYIKIQKYKHRKKTYSEEIETLQLFISSQNHS